ncbi:MAG TPA: hypothetical protein VG186_10445 [Solirubrobacteraceae bacterium]|nr:hypothetical protein [Solirubrobacteraceae bacterium]
MDRWSMFPAHDARNPSLLGNVYMKTSCGGSGRGGGYHTTTYSASASVNWNHAGAPS